MGGILSQDEVDALLTNMPGEKSEPEMEKAKERTAIVPFDLANQQRVVGDTMPALEIIFDRFSRCYQTSLASFLRRTARVTISSTKTIKFGQFMRTLPAPTSLHIFRLKPLKGGGLLLFQADMIFSIIDLLFGGRGSKAEMEGREFTPIEMRIINKLRDFALRDFEESWKSVYAVNSHFMRSENNPQFAAIIPPDDPVQISIFDVEVEETIGNLTILLPYTMIEPVKDKLTAAFQEDEESFDNWSQRFQPLLMGAKVNVVVELGSAVITCNDLLGLKEGDVIPLETCAVDPLRVKVEGVPKFTAYPGHHKGAMAVQIASMERRRY